MSLDEILNDMKSELDEKDRRREELFSLCREIRRSSTMAIREIHKEDYQAAKRLLKQAERLVVSMNEADKIHGFVQEALQEYAEGAATMAFLLKKTPPSPRELGVPSEAYILGLADAIGEIRRYIIDRIRKGEFGDVEHFLDLMDDIYHGIMAFDYPSALLPIRRKQDVARVLLERTRGDVTLALRQAELEKKIAGD
jgi:translin